MKLKRGNPLVMVGLLVMSLVAASAAEGQLPADTALVYEREVFVYTAEGRTDPFRSLLNDEELGVRIEDLTLRGIVHHNDPAQSVAVLALAGSERRLRLRVGERVGGIGVLAIYPDRIDLVVEELGVSRRETLRMTRTQQEPA